MVSPPIAIALALTCACSAPVRESARDVAPATRVEALRVASPSAADFDFLEGAWTSRQRRLHARGVGSTSWDEFPATLCARRYADGVVNVAQVVFPTKGWAGVTVRTFDVAQRRWSSYWISSRTGRLGEPTVGTFAGDRIEFRGQDVDDGHPVEVRSMWTKIGRDRARWEQAFSRDGKTWEVNWTAEFERADPAVTCAQRPTAAPSNEEEDFAYFEGGWRTHQRRLEARGVGSTSWEEFPGTLCMTPYLDGRVTVDELVFPTKGWSGVTVRAFDLSARTWSIYWINSRTGVVEAPVVGTFAGHRGEFYGDDRDGGRSIKVRYSWFKRDRDHARWEQAFSYDGAKTWEVNWTAEFERADTAAVCNAGRPRT